MNKKRIFIINGCGGVGKDTFVSLVSQNVKFKVANYSSVHEVKKIAKQIGWEGLKSEKDRKFLSDLKNICTNYNDMPFKAMSDRVLKFLLDDNEMWLFLHIREPEEIERAKKTFNATTILIRRDGITPIVTNMADKNVNNYGYDFIIGNNGTLEEFKAKALRFIKEVGGEMTEDNSGIVYCSHRHCPETDCMRHDIHIRRNYDVVYKVNNFKPNENKECPHKLAYEELMD